jgi:hypothetical protein
MADYLDYLMGVGETGATLGSGAMAGLLGMPYGVYKGATSSKYVEFVFEFRPQYATTFFIIYLQTAQPPEDRA